MFGIFMILLLKAVAMKFSDKCYEECSVRMATTNLGYSIQMSLLHNTQCIANMGLLFNTEIYNVRL